MMDVQVQLASPTHATMDVLMDDVQTTNGAAATDGQGATAELPSETLYIQNLNEGVKLPVIKQTLKNLFSNYGEVLDVVAHSNLRMRGQAFVSFADPELAGKALKEVNKFPLYGKPLQLSYARTRSDAVVQKLDNDKMEQHKAERLARKKRARADNPTRRKAQAKLQAATGDGAAPAPRRTTFQMPDEYLPPNKILFLQNLPESVNQQQLTLLFSQYPGLSEVRLVPVKKDIAFVEYVDENAAGVAKDALHNYKLDGEAKMKVTFARK